MSKKLRAAYAEDMNMNMVSEPCRANIKDLENQVERAKINLEAAIIVNNSHELNYELANQLVGSAYMTLRRVHKELKRRKAEK